MPLTGALAIELASARESGAKGTEGSAADAGLDGEDEGPAAPPCPKSPHVGGRTRGEYIRMVQGLGTRLSR